MPETGTFSLAKTWLIRAEAYFWEGQTDLAAADINVVRERANAPSVSDGEVDIDYIADERLRELSQEEFRHSGLVRIANIMAKNSIDGYSLDHFYENNWWYDRVMKYNTWYKLGWIGTTQYKNIIPDEGGMNHVYDRCRGQRASLHGTDGYMASIRRREYPEVARQCVIRFSRNQVYSSLLPAPSGFAGSQCGVFLFCCSRLRIQSLYIFGCQLDPDPWLRAGVSRRPG